MILYNAIERGKLFITGFAFHCKCPLPAGGKLLKSRVGLFRNREILKDCSWPEAVVCVKQIQRRISSALQLEAAFGPGPGKLVPEVGRDVGI